jgi:N-acetylglucosamine kinase-like BadF-type ATPase
LARLCCAVEAAYANTPLYLRAFLLGLPGFFACQLPLRPHNRHIQEHAIFLGLDCGGSSTRALALDGSGAVLFRGQAGPANLASTPKEQLRENVSKALMGCASPTAICGCFAGMLVEEQRTWAEQLLKDLYPKSQVRVEPDFAAALAASPDGTDVCVIAGTGSLVCSRPTGELAKSGGRGFVLGDYCSAFRFGRAYLQAFLETRDAELEPAILDIFGVSAEPELIAAVYGNGPIAPLLARLAKPFSKCATNGMHFAVQFLSTEMERLARIASHHLLEHHPAVPTPKFCLAGGLWQASSVFETTFSEKLRALSGNYKVEVARIRRTPVEGAAILAKGLISHEH